MWNQIGSQGVSLDIAHQLKEIFIGFDWKRFVPSLVNMTGSYQMFVLLPTLDMGIRQALHKSRQVAIAFRPKNKMPMGGHEAKGADPHRPDFKCLFQNMLKCRVISVIVEKPHSTRTTIQNMEQVSSSCNSRSPRHTITLTGYLPRFNICTCPLFPRFRNTVYS